MTIQKTAGVALVTGASSGIGAVYAQRLAQRGHDLILVARNGARLDQLAQRIAAETGRVAEIVIADLSDAADLARVEDILRHDASITMLVNNAGVGATAPLLDTDIARMDALITLNVTAATHLAYAAAPAFAARGHGTIINIASIAAIAPEILNGVYGASKAFVLALSQSMQHELSAKGVRVQAVLPGATATEFWGNAGLPAEHLPEGIVMSAQDMVDASLAGLDLGEFATIPALPDVADWAAYEAARQKMMPNLSKPQPAGRYGVAVRAAA